jgi:hypothetical protein
MQSTQERRRLLEHYRDEPCNPLVAMLKSIAGLVALVLVAVSPWLLLDSELARTASEQPAFRAARAFPSAAESRRALDGGRDRSATHKREDATAAGTAVRYPDSMAESRRIFDERRARWEGRGARTPSAPGAAFAQELDAGAARNGGERDAGKALP